MCGQVHWASRHWGQFCLTGNYKLLSSFPSLPTASPPSPHPKRSLAFGPTELAVVLFRINDADGNHIVTVFWDDPARHRPLLPKSPEAMWVGVLFASWIIPPAVDSRFILLPFSHLLPGSALCHLVWLFFPSSFHIEQPHPFPHHGEGLRPQQPWQCVCFLANSQDLCSLSGRRACSNQPIQRFIFPGRKMKLN